MDILNSTNYEYRANINQTQVPSEVKTAQTKPGPTGQASLQALPADRNASSEGTGETALSTADQTIAKALAASGLPMSDKNRTLVRELLHHKLPVDKQTLQMFAKLIAANRAASPLTLVLMYKNQIPITPANLNQFEAYQNGNHQLLKAIQSLAKNIVELIETLQKSQEPGVSAGPESLRNSLMAEASLTDGSAMPGTAEQNGTVSAHGASSLQNFHNPLEAFTSARADGNLPHNVNDIGGSYPTGTDGLPSGLTKLDGLTGSVVSINDPEVAAPIIETDGRVAGSQPLSGDIAQVVHTESGTQTPVVLPAADHKSGSLAESASLGNMKAAQELPLGAVPTQGDTSSGIRTADLLHWLSETLAASPDQEASKDINSFPKLITGEEGLPKSTVQIPAEGTLPELSPEILSNLEGLLRQKWTLTPEQLSDTNSLKELYKKLENDLNKLDGLIKFCRESEEILQSREPVRNLQDNLQFMKALNQLFSYVQLPLRIKDREVHGEFYVFNKKNALQSKKDILSVLLHLDMTELGAMNIHMKLQRNQIQATFAVENPEAGSIINGHLPELIDALSRKGYHLQARVEKQEHPQELIKDLLEQDPSGASVQTFSFDIRA